MAQSDMVGKKVGNFEILSEIGRGAMGVVYRARQAGLNRVVALKVLPPSLMTDPGYIARFYQEARSAAMLEHPYLIPIYEVGEFEGMHYIAMRFVEGQTLRDVMNAEGPMEALRVIELLTPVASALDYAHRNNIIHRDIKPSNIMVAKDGTAYLADFGLARATDTASGLTMAGTVMGTPDYMSPEQAEGSPNVGPPTDIYALGVVVYQMFTGELPFEGSSPMSLLAKRLLEAPRPPSDHRNTLPEAIEDVIMQALARDPARRFKSADELIRALRRAIGKSSNPSLPPADTAVSTSRPGPATGPVQAPSVASGSIPGTPPPAAPAPSAPARKGKALMWLGIGSASVIVLLCGCFALLMYIGATAEPAPEEVAEATREAETGSGLTTQGNDDQPPQAASSAELTDLLEEAQAAFERETGMDEALALYAEALELAPDNLQAHIGIATIYVLRGNGPEALEAAEAALEIDPQSALAHALRSEALNSQERYEEALEAANRAIAFDDTLSAGYTARAGVRSNLASLDLDEIGLARAAADAEQALELAASETTLRQALAHNIRAVTYWQEYSLAGDRAAAIGLIDAAIDELLLASELQPQIALFHSNLGFSYNAQGDHALNQNDDARADERFALAREAFETALATDPQYAEAYNGLGDSQFSQEAYDRALDFYQQALEADPQNASAYVNQGFVYRERDEPDFALAQAAFAEAAAISPENPAIYYWIADTYQFYQAYSFEYASDEFLSRLDEAETNYEQALTLNSNYVYALSGLAWVFYNREDYAGAEEQFQAAIAVKEDQSGAHNGLGWSRYYQEDYTGAQLAFERAIELLPDYVDANYGLGLSLEQLGNTEAAIAAFEQVIKVASPDDWRVERSQEALERLRNPGASGEPANPPTQVIRDPDQLADPANIDGWTSGAGDTGGSSTEAADNAGLRLEAIPQGAVTIGTPVQATLDTQAAAHDWSFAGRAGQVITIRCTAAPGNETDPRMNLLAPDGTWLIANDDGGEGLNAVVADFALPADGTYTIKIDVFTTGPYVLSVESAEAAASQLNTLPIYPNAQPVPADDPVAQELASSIAESVGDEFQFTANLYTVPSSLTFAEVQGFYNEALAPAGWNLFEEAQEDLTEGIQQHYAGWLLNNDAVLVSLISGPGIEEGIPGQSYLLLGWLSQRTNT